MTYRDDHEALHARVQELERDLTRARQDAAEGEEAKQRAAELQRQLERAQRELERLRPQTPRKPGKAPLLVVFAALVVAGAAGAFVFMVRGGERNEATSQLEAAAKAQRDSEAAARLRELEAKRVQAIRAEAEEAQRRAREAALGLASKQGPGPRLKVKYPPGTARWAANVKSATGVRVKTPCWLVAELVEKGLDSLELSCGKKVLYSSKDPLSGMSMGSRQLELSGRRLMLSYVDQGARSGKRNQIAVNTPEQRIEVWRDADPRFRVTLAVHPASLPLTSPPAEAAP